MIGVGAALDGSSITEIGLNRFGLNDSGSIVFQATLADGRTGIYRADATAVPEPSSLISGGIGLAVLGIGRTALWRTRAAYLQGGIDLAVFDVARSGRPRQYDTDAEARVTALACSPAPEGRQRWTMVELERAARQEPGLDTVSRETVRRMLKKTTSSPGAG